MNEKEIKQKIDRIMGRSPKQPLSDYVKERLKRMRKQGLISSKPLD